MNKKVIVFGGGTGLSYLLRGLKQYPLDITAVVSVCDDGGSTGKLRTEFNVLAPGDIRKVIESLSDNENEISKLLNYRFESNGELNNHSLGNLILLAEMKIQGSAQKAIETLSDILKLKGRVLPFTEDKVTLIGEMDDGSIVEGEHNITKTPGNIKKVYYKENPTINEEILEEINSADLIILSMGSLFTSVIPNLLSDKIKSAIDKSNASIVYCCNLFTQPGETDEFKVSDHINVLNSYLGNRKIEYVIANDGEIDGNLANKYATEEQKDPVILDKKEVEKLGVKIINDDLVYIKKYSEDQRDVYRHNYVKLGFLINTIALGYAYMLNKKRKKQ
ncbi:MAG: YvcK family protein [Bacilli bacterium]|nr:YvcK family protein [Bacilli bacterium]